jgi:hypothetical protein
MAEGAVGSKVNPMGDAAVPAFKWAERYADSDLLEAIRTILEQSKAPLGSVSAVVERSVYLNGDLLMGGDGNPASIVTLIEDLMESEHFPASVSVIADLSKQQFGRQQEIQSSIVNAGGMVFDPDPNESFQQSVLKKVPAIQRGAAWARQWAEQEKTRPSGIQPDSGSYEAYRYSDEKFRELLTDISSDDESKSVAS